jgi:phosphoribosylformimino-5-aminoimidazole carboxamide ribotide isomerase
MPLQIIPAIELRDGKAVRTQRGPTGAEARVAADPVKTAKEFADAGVPRLHLIDLDGIRMGTPQNVPAIRDIVRRAGVPVQVAGGMKTRELAERVLNAGAERVVIGTTVASRDDALMLDLLAVYGERIVVAADARGGFVATDGFTTRPAETLAEFGKRLARAGARRFLFTDVAREGTLDGVDDAAAVAFARAAGVPVLAAGGVAGPGDIEKLARMQPEGVEGVIVGKALYAGVLTLADALRIAAGTTA